MPQTIFNSPPAPPASSQGWGSSVPLCVYVLYVLYGLVRWVSFLTGVLYTFPMCIHVDGYVFILFVCRSTSASPQNVVQLSVHLATTLLDVTVKFLERALEAGLTPPTLQLLGSSFMFSTLLPTTLAQLGPVACRQPRVYLSY